jgi:hypothetical protein
MWAALPLPTECRCFAGIGLEPSDQLAGILGRQPGPADDDHRRKGEQGDRLEISQKVVWNWVERTGADMTGPIADAERVSVGRRSSSTADADRRSRSGHIFDDDRLAQREAHAFAKDAPERIGRASGRKRHDHRQRVRRVRLCLRQRNRSKRKGERRERDLHVFPPGPFGTHMTPTLGS